MPPKKKTGASAPAAPPAAASTSPASQSSSHAVSLSHAANLEFTKKLQPIYDALDSSNYKSALKLLSSSISKYGRRPLLLTLLALTHARLDQRTEASTLAEEVVASHPTDPHLLSTVSLVYKHINQPHLIPPLYEQALSIIPASSPPQEDLLLSLFFALTALHSYPAAQKVAMRLYTATKSPHYLFFSLLNHLLPLPSTPSPSPLLLLSERMIRRGCPLPSLRPDDVELMAEALERQGEVGREVEWWEGDEGKLYRGVYDEEWGRRMAEALGRAGKKRKEREMWENLSLKYEGDWHYLSRWMECQIERLDWKSTGGPGEEGEDELSEEDRIQHMRSIIDKLKNDASNVGGRQRNPHLASVHLSYLLLLRRSSDESQTELLKEVVEYYRRHGDKPCFINDCQPYLIAFPPPLRLSLLEKMREIAGADYLIGQPASDGASRIPHLVSLHQTFRFLSLQGSSVEEAESLALSYYHHFLLSSSLSHQPLSTSRGAGDPFLVLVSSALYDLYDMTGKSDYLFTLSCLLEHAHSFSPSNFDFSLHLLRLYSHPCLSTPARSLSLYSSLQIKQIQHESLSHLLLHDLLRLGLISSAYSLAGWVGGVHSQWERDEGAVLQMAYEQKRWGKVLEMKEMTDRLEKSWGKRWIMEERRWMEVVRSSSMEVGALMQVMEKHDEERKEEEGEMIVNSDYSIIPCYEPATSRLHVQLNRPPPSLLPSFSPLRSPTPTRRDSTYAVDEEYLTYLHYKRLVPSLLSSSIAADALALRSHLSTLKSLLSSLGCASFPSDAPPSLPKGFDGLHWWFSFLCLETTACLLECKEPTALLLSSSPTPSQLDDHVIRWTSIQRQFHVLIDLLSSLSPFISPVALQQPMDEKRAVLDGKALSRPFDPSVLRYCSLFLHHAALFLTVCLQVCTQHSPNRKSAQKKKKKEGGGEEEERAVWEVLANVRMSLAGLIKTSREILEGVGEMMRGLGGVEVDWSPDFPFLQRAAEVVEEVSGGSVREVGDLDTFVSKGIAGCMESWTKNGEEMGKIVSAYLQSLQHIKLP